MVIDTSALLAMLFGEPECGAIARAVDADPIRMVSAVSVFEAGLVSTARVGTDGLDDLDLLLTRMHAEIKSFTVRDLPLAREAFVRFGKGRHRAALNFGDCFAYALSVSSGEPLLFKGEDFSRTDVLTVKY